MEQEKPIIDECRRTLEELYDDLHTGFSKRTNELLSQLRILTREKVLTPDILNDKCLQTLVSCSAQRQIEAQKCLSNLILNYLHVRRPLVQPYVECVEKRLRHALHELPEAENDVSASTDEESNRDQCEILYYDLRIVFLLSALCPDSRQNISDRLSSLLLKVTLIEAENLREENFLLVNESLKTLFNLTMDKCSDVDLASSVISRLFSQINNPLEVKCVDRVTLEHIQMDQLLIGLIHLLTNMPKDVYLRLSNSDVDRVLNHLDNQLKTFTKDSFRDTVLPVLNTCANICRYKEDVRQRWFQDILESTKDFEKRPEEYDTLRGRLVKLMTSVDVHIKDIAAEFLHALCGGDTEKFITYTGFGNSAAFLSTRGLLSQRFKEGDSFSSTSSVAVGSQSTSDKDYKELREKLDPITGSLEQPKKDPMEGMTDEEKEWHADQLAEAIAKLSTLGVIKPMQIGANGQLSELKPKESHGCE